MHALLLRRSTGLNIAIEAGQILMASLFIALCAQIRVPLPFTPVPVTMQTFAVMMIAALFGSRKGALAAAAYLTEVVCGWPVLSLARSDVLALFSPIGGYLLGFVAQAYIAGWLIERRHSLDKAFDGRYLLGSLMASSLVNLMFGALVLGLFVGFGNVLAFGILPFIPGEMLKAMVATSLLKGPLKAISAKH